jgi:hypothetical protein
MHQIASYRNGVRGAVGTPMPTAHQAELFARIDSRAVVAGFDGGAPSRRELVLTRTYHEPIMTRLSPRQIMSEIVNVLLSPAAACFQVSNPICSNT